MVVVTVMGLESMKGDRDGGSDGDGIGKHEG